MDLYLSKIVPLLVYPLGLALLLTILAAVLVKYSANLARLLLLVAVSVLWVASTPIFADHISFTLEKQFPPVAVDDTPSADVIVVLGGAIGGTQPPRIVPDLSDAADRVLHAARLYRAGKAPVVLASGGSIAWLGSTDAEANAIQALLTEWGVPADAVITETASRNTFENATFSKQLLEERGPQRVLLVTSALHMRRALATFRTAGMDTVPGTTDFTVTYNNHRTALDFLPDAVALSRTTYALKEYIGYAYYRWKGWIHDDSSGS